MFIIDAHLDLAMNAMEWNRDLRLPVSEIRAHEEGLNDKPDRGNGTVSLPALRAGRVGLVVATQIARYAAPGHPLPGWNSPEQAWAQTQAQLAWYRAMEAEGEMIMITDSNTLERHLTLWMEADTAPGMSGGSVGEGMSGRSVGEGDDWRLVGTEVDSRPVGYILSLEGADSLITPAYVEKAWQYGLRAIGPAHYGPGRYAFGTDAQAGLSARAKELLKEMERFGIILDATHLCDAAFWDAMDWFGGPVWASHNNCRAIVDHNRQFSDEMIKALVGRGAVIGGALDAWMMVPGWRRGVSEPRDMHCDLEKLVDHLDHICQLAGNSLHAALGTDLDGAFGKEQCPYDLDTIADLQKFPALLSLRGYGDMDIANIMHGNWLRFLRKAWAGVP